MIPLKDQEAIRVKFAQEMLGPVKIDYITQKELEIVLPGREPCAYCKPTGEMLRAVAAHSDRISLRVHNLEDEREEGAKFGVERIPGIVLRAEPPPHRLELHPVQAGCPDLRWRPAVTSGVVPDAMRELHPVEQSLDELRLEGAIYAHGIFAVDASRRVHQSVRQRAIVGEQKDTTGVEIEPPDTHPAPRPQSRQTRKNGGSSFGVVPRADLPCALVVQQHSRSGWLDGDLYALLAELDDIAIADK